MLINAPKMNLDLDELESKFKIEFSKIDESVPDLISLLNISPSKFLLHIENKTISFKKIEKDLLIKIFYYTCNMLKEIEWKTILLGLKIMNLIVYYIPEEYFLNAYVFEKTLVKMSSTQQVGAKKKFVSVGDYELAKFDTNLGMNYGFFASALEEQKKEIKIETLKLISKIGADCENKEFAKKSFKYTIELVNDEEDEVRYETIKCLEKLICNFKIIEFNSCEIIFFNLKEKSLNLRKLLYSLCSKIFNENFEEFNSVRKVLVDNLMIFPECKHIIFDCLKSFFQNNFEQITNEYIFSLLDIDSNYLITEPDWNNLIYISNLILIQEYIKGNNFKLEINLPKFLIKHYNYLSDKYPKNFDKSIYSFLMKNSINYIDTKEEYTSNDIEMKSFISSLKINSHLKQENISNIINSLKNYQNYSKYLEVYQTIFSFLKIFINFNEGRDSKDDNHLNNHSDLMKILLAADKLINILEIINFDLNLINFRRGFVIGKNLDVMYVNKFICAFILIKLNKYLDLSTNFPEDHKLFKWMSEIVEYLKNKNIFVSILSLVEGDDVSNLGIEKISNYFEKEFEFLCINYYEVLQLSPVQVKVTNPKMNFSYIHIKDKDGLKYPFFLQVHVKLRNTMIEMSNSNKEISKNFLLDTFISKNLIINIHRLKEQKRVEIHPSQVKSYENIISIQTKIPILVDENYSEEYSIHIFVRSNFKKEMSDIFSKVDLFTLHSDFPCYIQLNDNIKFTISY